MAKRTNWQRLSKQSNADTMQYRDVYEDQQLERSTIQEKQTPTLRIIFSVVVALFAALVMWLLASAGAWQSARFRAIRERWGAPESL